MLRMYFPKNHPSFANDFITLNKISTIEDLIELKHQCISLSHAITPIITIYDKPASQRQKLPMDPELLASLSEFTDSFPKTPRSQLDIDRDAIWDMKYRSGTLYVLGFLDTKLMLSMETLFSGVVIGYMQMFNDTKIRHKLSPNKVFRDHPELKDFHEKTLITLRNDQYAHKSAVEGQHHLSYYLNDDKKILVDEDAAHFGVEFHIEHCHLVYKCIHQTMNSIAQEIAIRSKKLLSELTPAQNESLRDQWANPEKATARVLVDTPLSPRPPKPAPPKD